MRRDYRYAWGELAGQPLALLTNEEHECSLAGVADEVPGDARARTVLLECRHGDRTSLRNELTVSPVAGAPGRQAAHLVCVARDVTGSASRKSGWPSCGGTKN